MKPQSEFHSSNHYETYAKAPQKKKNNRQTYINRFNESRKT